ncbi:MAG TPA: hypothetical protein VNL38_01555 [Candidatus Nitrosotenuis sp.]|nr:hypothetical protein [Candidatus Nitrosotenuis sp.]
MSKPTEHRLALILVGLFLTACSPSASAQVPKPGQGSSREQLQRVTPKPAPRTTVPLPVFEFHSGFWLNLHHVLYEQARLREQRPIVRADAARKLAPVPSVRAAELTPAEAAGWNAALDYYATNLASRDLQFDGDLVNIKNRLAELENCDDLSGRSAPQCVSGLRAEQIAALERAAPVYRARWWKAHDAQNRAWIATVTPLVETSGTPLATQLSLLFHVDWPARLRVDMSVYAGPLGGYTNVDPFFVTISSADERNRDAGALQVLFHEAAHALGGNVREAIAREFRARSRPIPRELWSALLCYTTAELARRTAPSGKNYLPLPVADALAARGWRSYRSVLERHWQLYIEAFLRGNADPDEINQAIARIAATL